LDLKDWPMKKENFYEEIVPSMGEENSKKLFSAANVRVERIESFGHASPEGFWYDQDHPEWVLLLKGAAKLLFEGDDHPLTLLPGDYVNIPAHLKHRVEWTTPSEPTFWLALHYDEKS
jgi:cupin 2 domain-containing protein